MKILLTGASSFTGFWFARALADAGHDLVMALPRALDDYEGTRRARVDDLLGIGETVFECDFGGERFMQTVTAQDRWDLLCHHASQVGDYKDPAFDIAGALASNTRNVDAILASMGERGCTRLIYTGSVFESGEGAGSEGLPAFSPYGLSKAVTSHVLADRARVHDMHYGKFVISNPFGPYEEPRFVAYLFRTWMAGETPVVRTPAYVRDNIHVTLLARAYADFAATLPGGGGMSRVNPSGYIETQGCFARRVAEAMRPRLGLACGLECARQIEFGEPRIRISTDPTDPERLGWDESAAWDELASYYRQALSVGPGSS